MAAPVTEMGHTRGWAGGAQGRKSEVLSDMLILRCASAPLWMVQVGDQMSLVDRRDAWQWATLGAFIALD